MATDHRGNNVGNPATSHGGHRPTPRLARAYNKLVQVAMGGEADDFTDEEAQEGLNAYRDKRDQIARSGGPTGSGHIGLNISVGDVVQQARGVTPEHVEDWMFPDQTGPSSMSHDRTRYIN